MKKILISLLLIVVMGCVYLYNYNNRELNTVSTEYTTVIFQSENEMLIPVSIPYHNEEDLEMDLKNKIDIMKSDDYICYGLYPVLSEHLQLNYAELKDNQLNLDFNNQFNNKNIINTLESLSFLLKDYKDYQIHLTINNQTYDYIPETSISSAYINKHIPLNNFTDYSSNITESKSITLYKQEQISNKNYYIPYTIRINNNNLETMITETLSYIDPSLDIKQVDYKDHTIHLYLSSHLLLDNERIDPHLENCIYLTLLSFESVKDIKIYVNNEEVGEYNNKEIILNYIEL